MYLLLKGNKWVMFLFISILYSWGAYIMKKIIYFDETSALDLIDIKSKGRSEEILQSMVDKASKFGGKVYWYRMVR